MKLKNILIVVKDIEASKQFYHDLFGLNLVLDNDGNMVLTEGLVLQDEKIWRKFLGKDVIPKSNSCELYFEEQDKMCIRDRLSAVRPPRANPGRLPAETVTVQLPLPQYSPEQQARESFVRP